MLCKKRYGGEGCGPLVDLKSRKRSGSGEGGEKEEREEEAGDVLTLSCNN